MRPESFDVFCPHCNIQAEARVIANGHGGFHSEGAERFDEIDAEYHGDTYYVALCRRCKSPFLIRQSLYGIPGEFETMTAEDVLFPHSSRLPIEGLPPAVQRALEQAVRSFASSSFDACALMCRRALEALSRQGAIDTRLAT